MKKKKQQDHEMFLFVCRAFQLHIFTFLSARERKQCMPHTSTFAKYSYVYLSIDKISSIIWMKVKIIVERERQPKRIVRYMPSAKCMNVCGAL